MTVRVGNTPPAEPVGPETAPHRSGRVALILSLSILFIGGIYFGALYLIAR
jgi:hypothetical protein